jgi:S1-C subfamily serine protease
MRLQTPIRWWVRLLVWTSVIFLPAACLLSVVMRVVQRNSEPRVRVAWLTMLNSLLVASSLITSIAFVLMLSLSPVQPSVVSEGLSELDTRVSFPSVSRDHDLSAEEIAASFKPLVTVISPTQRRWFSHNDAPSAAFGAGVVLGAGPEGYLIATARHVVDGESRTQHRQSALVASTSGTWATAQVVARHSTLDLILLWLPRAMGTGYFDFPIARIDQVRDGSSVYVIGHPQGLRFTLSTGIVSRKDQDTIQTTAPISPGNSGGPLIDSHGRLAGIVTSMVDRGRSPNAEDLNFAVRADALLDSSGWRFSGSGRRYLEEFQRAQNQNKPEGKVN